MAKDVTIRAAIAADLPTLGRLGALLVELHHDLNPNRFIPATPQTEERYGWFLGTQIGKRDVFVLVAESEGSIVGTLTLEWRVSTTWRCEDRPARCTTSWWIRRSAAEASVGSC
jgi:hypothetical protein